MVELKEASEAGITCWRACGETGRIENEASELQRNWKKVVVYRAL